MPPRLTPLRKTLLETLYQLSRSGPVTPISLAEAMEVGRSSIRDHIEALEELGLLEREILSPVKVHLHLTDLAREAVGVGYAHLGEIAAGLPILAHGEVERRIETLEDVLPLERGDFFLTVRDNSMCDAGICDRDLALIRPQPWAEDGDIAVVLLPGDNAATLKYFFAEGDFVRLEPANPQFLSMTFPSDRVIVQGVCLGHISTVSSVRRERA